MPEPSIAESASNFSSISALVGALVTGTPLAKLLHSQVKTNQRHESAIEQIRKQLEDHVVNTQSNAEKRGQQIEELHKRINEVIQGQNNVVSQLASGVAELKGYILGIQGKDK